jgi:hypothetical protein
MPRWSKNLIHKDSSYCVLGLAAGALEWQARLLVTMYIISNEATLLSHLSTCPDKSRR